MIFQFKTLTININPFLKIFQGSRETQQTIKKFVLNWKMKICGGDSMSLEQKWLLQKLEGKHINLDTCFRGIFPFLHQFLRKISRISFSPPFFAGKISIHCELTTRNIKPGKSRDRIPLQRIVQKNCCDRQSDPFTPCSCENDLILL